MTIITQMNEAQKGEFKTAIIDSGGATLDMINELNLKSNKLLRPRRIVLLGDSFAASNDAALSGYGYSLTPYNGPPFTSVLERPSSYMGWFSILSGNQFEYDHTLNKGISGNSTAQMLARFDSDVATSDAAILIYQGGTNDPQAGIEAAGTIENDKAVLKKARALGMHVFLCAISPRGSWQDSPPASVADTRRRYMFHVNAWREAAAKRLPGVTYVDFYGPWAVQSGTDANPGSVYVQADGLHPSNNMGGFVLGKALWDAFQSAGYGYPTPSRNYNLSKAKAYNATENPYGNRLVNGPMVGTTGTVQANITGTVATGWLAQWQARTAGTAVGSQVSRRDGLGLCQQVVITAPGGVINETIQFTQQAAIYAPVTPGATAVFRVGVEVINPVGFRGLQVYLRYRQGEAGDGTILQEVGLMHPQAGPLPEQDWFGIMETEPLEVPLDSQSVDIFIRATVNGTEPNNSVTLKLYDAFYGNIPTDSDIEV